MIYILCYDDHPIGEAYLAEQFTEQYEEELVYDCDFALKQHDHVLLISSDIIKEHNLNLQRFTTVQPYGIELIAGTKVNVNKL